MRRFERLRVTPVRWWEVTVRGAQVRTREGVGATASNDHSEDFASAADAQARADAWIAERREAGYVEIKRLAAIPQDEPPNDRRERFEWDDGDVRRYRELVQDGKVVTSVTGVIAHGRRDRDGVPDDRAFRTVAEATAFYDLWRADVDDAVARAAGRASAPPSVRDAALEAQCLAAEPGDAAPWSVYADWLSSHGDPLGDIASLALGGRPGDARAAIRTHYAALWQTRTGDASIELELRHGFPRSASFVLYGHTVPLDALVAGVLGSPLCRFVDAVKTGPATHARTDWGPTVSAIVASPRAHALRELRLEARNADLSRLYVGTLALTGLPALETLVIEGDHAQLATLELPSLRTLVRRTTALSAAELATIMDARWPQLERLELWLGSRARGGFATVADLRSLLTARRFPRLAELAILDSELVEELLAALPGAAVLPQLHALELAMGNAGRHAARTLQQHASAFRHLAVLDLSSNLLRAADVAQIRGVLDNVIVTHQRDDTFDDRFVAVTE